jgi:hypothetical protein
MSTPADVRHTDPARLSGILVFGGPDCPWEAGELEAVLRHQLASPLRYNLAPPDNSPTPLERDAFVEGSVADLLCHPHPSMDHLERLKRFAKAHAVDAQSPLPREIAMLLYYAAIVVALVRCNARITDLDDAALCRGIDGMLASPWIDPPTRDLLAAGRARLGTPPRS